MPSAEDAGAALGEINASRWVTKMEKYEKPSTADQADADEDDDDLFGPVPTFEVANEQRAQRIKELEIGSSADRRLAALLSNCRKGSRCHLHECAVCERRKLIAYRGVPASVVKSIGSLFQRTTLEIKAIQVVAKHRRPLNEAKVQAIAASMNQIGLQTPITVQAFKRKVTLVAGWHRLEAAKRLSWDSIPCVVLTGELETRFWQIAENFYRAELTALGRAEGTEELRTLIKKMPLGEGRLAPPGGRQPNDLGIKKTARALGLTREEIRRSKTIAEISPAAKAKVRKLGLDDNQRALLEIAKQSTPKAQLRAVKTIVERKRAARARKASAAAGVADKKTAAEISILELDIRKKEKSLEGLKGELAADHKRLREIEDKLAVQGVAKAGDDQSMVPAEDVDKSARRVADEGTFERLKDRWEKYLALDWNDAPAETRAQFIAKVLGYSERVG